MYYLQCKSAADLEVKEIMNVWVIADIAIESMCRKVILSRTGNG